MTPDGSTPPRPWYTTAFDETYLQAFAPALTAERTVEEVDGLEALLGADERLRVLDLACGQGRHAIELAGRGHDVIGLDRSATLLGRARTAPGGAGVAWVRADLRAVPLRDGTVGAVVNLFNSFGYLEDDAEDRRVLEEVARVLAPDGLFLQEVVHRDALARDLERVTATRLDDRTLLVEEHDLDLRSSRHAVRYTLADDDGGPLRRFTTSQRVYTVTELLALHRAAGLAPETVTGSLAEGGEPELDDPLLVVRSRCA